MMLCCSVRGNNSHCFVGESHYFGELLLLLLERTQNWRMPLLQCNHGPFGGVETVPSPSLCFLASSRSVNELRRMRMRGGGGRGGGDDAIQYYCRRKRRCRRRRRRSQSLESKKRAEEEEEETFPPFILKEPNHSDVLSLPPPLPFELDSKDEKKLLLLLRRTNIIRNSPPPRGHSATIILSGEFNHQIRVVS